MSILVIYLVGLFVIFLLSLVAALNFYRLRFKGDKTVTLIILFAAVCLADIGLTIALFVPENNTPTQTSTSYPLVP